MSNPIAACVTAYLVHVAETHLVAAFHTAPGNHHGDGDQPQSTVILYPSWDLCYKDIISTLLFFCIHPLGGYMVQGYISTLPQPFCSIS